MNENEKCERIVELIEMLVCNEAASLIIMCPNPDFNDLPNRIVEISDDWTEYLGVRVGGEDLLDALENTEILCQATANKKKLRHHYRKLREKSDDL